MSVRWRHHDDSETLCVARRALGLPAQRSDRPAAAARDSGKTLVRVDGDRTLDQLEQRQIVDRVAVEDAACKGFASVRKPASQPLDLVMSDTGSDAGGRPSAKRGDGRSSVGVESPVRASP